jgi:hypothetical protein
LEAADLLIQLRVLHHEAVMLSNELNKASFNGSFYYVVISSRFTMNHTVLSRVVLLSSPPFEKSKLGVLLVPDKVVVFLLRPFRPRVTRLNSNSGGEKPLCGKEHVAC